MSQKIDGKVQSIVVQAWDESDLSQQEAAGWKLTKTDPEKVRDEAAPPPPEPPAEPVNPKNTKEK